jgi:hypothetical protein
VRALVSGSSSHTFLGCYFVSWGVSRAGARMKMIG